MSERFGTAAVRHAGLAARLLGWRPGEFWAATPAELAASLGQPEAALAPTPRPTMDRLHLQRLMDEDDGRTG